MNRRVVITGYGIISSIGNNKEQVLSSLLAGTSGAKRAEKYAELGFRSRVYCPIELDIEAHIGRKLRRFMGDGSAYAYLAMQQAIKHADLSAKQISHPRTGLVTGSGGASTENIVAAADILRARGLRKVNPCMVPRAMSSTTSACLSTSYGIKGVSYSISSACATSTHCIGNGAELIQAGKQDIMFAGGGEEVHWTLSVLFDAMGAMSSAYNDTPELASRPYDMDRDGFVISGGGGILVLEELEHARMRDATIYAEVCGYGATCDGADMVQPSGEGGVRCMRMAMEEASQAGVTQIDYINTHGTSTPAGDCKELVAIAKVFGSSIPPISSTKSLTGHALGAAGVHEAIYALLMMEHDFIAASANIHQLDPNAAAYPIVRERRDQTKVNTVLSNGFGFGGTNASLVLQRFKN